MSEYQKFISGKVKAAAPAGIEHDGLSPHLFDFQRAVVSWALRRGRAAIFADCGMGKTIMQLEWARHIPGRVLIVAPLAVAGQTVAEGARFGIAAKYLRADDGETRIVVTNYEMVEHFNPAAFTGVVLDESSILKSFTGSTRNELIERFGAVPYRLCCTATPAPNDYTELGNHAEFLSVMSRVEMLATFFVHDGETTQEWRLKGHAEEPFWKWLASWSVVMRSPADLGFDASGFVLPPINHVQHVVSSPPSEGALFAFQVAGLQERIAARKASVGNRVARMAEIVNERDEPWIIWCNLNTESKALVAAIPDAIEVEGSMSLDQKVERLTGFTEGRYRVLVTKSSIAGFGMNWQHCRNVGFVGLTDSWEQYYQAVRRCWRFGQTQNVNVHVVTAEAEGPVVVNIRKKEAAAAVMGSRIVEHMREAMKENIQGAVETSDTYETKTVTGDNWTMHLGDCVETVAKMEPDSIDYSIFSPPFASLYTYSASTRDMGNCSDHADFHKHFGYLVDQLFRVIKPGRLLSFHCMNLPTTKVRDGFIGITDFRGELIRTFVSAGFIYHSEVVIWKDPVTAMQRTKALGLLYKQLRKDSTMSRQGIPDYVVTMRRPGVNPDPVSHEPEDFPVGVWQRYASPVWMDINPSRTLQHRSAREDKDEKHICPLQLDVIERCMDLWTNPGDLVLSPFAGIGSEGVVSIERGRKFVGCELKRSYFDQACRNLAGAKGTTGDLFSRVTGAAL